MRTVKGEPADKIVRAPVVKGLGAWADRIVRASMLALVFAWILGAGTSAFAASELRVGHVFGTPGSTVLVPIRGSSSTNIVAAQFDLLSGNANLADEDALPGPALAGHEVTSGRPDPGVRRVVIHSATNATLGHGTWAYVPLTLSSNAPEGAIELTLANVLLADYDGAAVTNVTVLAGSLTVTSSIPEVPVIVRQPAGETVVAGLGVVLEVSVLGRGPLTYQWQRNGTNLPGATADALALNPVRSPLAGDYRVVVGYGSGSVTSDVAALSVTLPPLLLASYGAGTVNPAPADYALGDTVTVTAEAGRWFRFARWTDGSTLNPRPVTIAPINRFTAIFTNTVPLEPFAEVEWQAAFGGIDEERACDGVVPTPDGGFLVLATSASGVGGNKQTPGFGGRDLWLLKLGANGGKQWERVFGGAQDDLAAGLIALPNGTYVLGGRSRSGVDGNKTVAAFGALDFWLIGVDGQGQVLWQRAYGSTGEDTFTTLRASADGGFFALGSSGSAEGGNKTSTHYGQLDIWALKLDARGNKIWDITLGGAEDDEVLGAAEATSDGGLLLGGTSASGVFGSKTIAGFGDADFWTVRVDAQGRILWQRDDGGNVDDAAFGLAQTVDGGALVTGYSLGGHGGNRTSPSQGGVDGWLVKLDGAGGKTWEQNYGGSGYDAFTSVLATWDNGVLLAGSTDSPADGNKWNDTFGGLDAWLMKVDAGGYRQWEWSLGGTANDELGGVCRIGNEGFLAAISSQSLDNGNRTAPPLGGGDLWLVKIANCDLPVGYPRIYVDGQRYLGGTAEFFRTNSVEVAFGSSFENAQIFYTLDGSPPDAGSEPYSGPFQVSPQLQPVVVRALAFDQFYDNFWEADPVTLVVHGYGVTTSVAGQGSIRLTPEPPVVKYTEVQAQALPAAGWAFDHWSGALGGEQPVQTISVEADILLQAHFIPLYTLTVSTQGQGTLLLDPPAGPYRSNTVVTLTAQPAPGWTFRNWSGDATGASASAAVTMRGPRNVGAVFVRQFAVGATTPGGGSVTMNPPQPVVADGTTVTLTAMPLAGWTFLGWQGDVIGSSNPLPVLVRRDLSIQGVFGTGLTTVTNPAGFGSILREPAAGPYPYGSVVRLSAVPLPGKFFSIWGGAATGLSNSPLALRVTNANPSVSAIFGTLVTNRFSLTTLVTGQGTVTKTPPQSWYSNGVSVTLTALPSADREFVGWSGDATGTNNPLTVLMNTNKTITAAFSGAAPSIVSAPASQTVEAGFDVTFTVSVSGTAPLSCQWYRNGVAIPQATGLSLVLSRVSPADEGAYTVAVSNSGGSTLSAPPAILSVNQEYTFITLAGLAGVSGSADGTGSAARFYNPAGLSVDSAGNVYVGDALNHTIRKVTAAGEVTTVAGLAGNAGAVDGRGEGARFNSPFGAAVDRAGNVYVGDTINHTIRKVSAAGDVITLAGLAGVQGSADGTGSDARFDWPFEVAVDRDDNLYVVDSHNHVIRKVTAGGVVTTFAGSPGNPGSADGSGTAARFSGPVGVAVDAAGYVYVADTYNHVIRKVSPAGEVWTLAGVAGSAGSMDGTGGAARFSYPYTVAVDSAGNVFVADHYNNAIRKVSPGGEVTTVGGLAGTTGSDDGTGRAARFNHPAGVAVDQEGNLYVTDLHNLTIRKGVPACPDRPVLAQSQGMVGASLQLDTAPRTAAAWEWTIQQRPAGSLATLSAANVRNPTFTPDAPGRYVFQLRATDAAGAFAIRSVEFNAVGPIEEYTFITLAGLAGVSGSADGVGSAARFNLPQNVAVDRAGNLYSADQWTHTIRKVTAAGDVSTVAGLAGTPGSEDGTGSAARFNSPMGVAVDGAGNIYVVDSGNHTVRKMTAAGEVTTLAGSPGTSGIADGWGGAARFSSPISVAVDSAGNVYVADHSNHTIRKVSAAGEVTTVAGLAGSSGSADGVGGEARFHYPFGVVVDSVGNAYVADSHNHTVRKVTAAGVVTTLAGAAAIAGSADGTAGAARFNFPSGLAVDSVGNLYVADTKNSTIRKVTAAGVVTTLAGWALSPGSTDGTALTARFFEPHGVAVDSVGNLYVADTENSTIRKGVPARVDRPEIITHPQSQTNLVGSSVTFTVQALGSSPLAYEWSKDGFILSDGGSLSGATNSTLTITGVQLTDAGGYSVIVANAFGSATSHVAQLTVTQTNHPPTADTLVVSTDEDVAVGFTLTGSDADLDPLTFEVLTSPASGTLMGLPPNLTYIPATNVNGQVQFTFRVRDGLTNSAPAPVTIDIAPVNDPPVLGTLGNRAVSEGSLMSFTATATDPDLPAQTLTFSLAPGAPAGASITTGGLFTWTPTEAQGPSTNAITVSVSDGVTNVLATFYAAANEVNRSPAFLALLDRSLGTGGTLRFILPGTDPDIPTNRLTYALISGPTGLTVDAATGEVVWTPGGTFGGTTNTVTVRVTDDGAPPLSTSASFRIEVVANAAPVVVETGAEPRVPEGVAWSIIVEANDPDGPREALRFSLEAGAPDGMTIDAVTGELRWTPTESQGPSTNRVIVRVTDAGIPPSSGTGTVRVAVEEVNTAPVLEPIALQHADPQNQLTVTARGHDADLPSNTLRYAIVSGPPGAMVDPVTGVFRWTPGPGDAGAIVPAILQVVDSGMPPLQATQAFAIQVSGCPPGGMRILVDGVCYGPETHVTVTNGAVLRIEPTFERSLVLYTLDGQMPDESSPEFNADVPITTSVIVRARAVDLDGGDMQEAGPVHVDVVQAYHVLARASGGGGIALHPVREPVTNTLGVRYGPYPGGTTVELTAMPAPGWSFLNWERAAAAGGAQVTWPLRLLADAEVEAAFGTRIVLTNLTNGFIHVAPVADLYRHGTKVRVTAEPAAGYYHRFWQGTGLPTTPVPLELTLTNPEPRLSAIFSRLATNQLTLTVLTDGPGSVTVDPLQNVYTNDQVVCVTATAALPSNPFLGWSGLTNSTAGQVCMKLSGSQTNFTLTAHFSTNALPFWFSPTAVAVTESNRVAQLTVQRGPSAPATVGFRTRPGTALPLDEDGWGDYTATNGVLVFGNGATETTLGVALRDNHSYQSNRVFSVELFDPASTDSVFATAAVTVVEDDPPSTDCSVLVRKVDGGDVSQATLRVILEPGLAGMKWRLAYEHTWHSSGDAVNLLAGDYELRFKPVAGYEPPGWSTNGLELHYLRVEAGLQQVTKAYTAIAAQDLPNGADVLMFPAEVRSQAQWRLVGETQWHSGERTNLAIGEHLVEFSAVEGYVAPLAQTVVVGPTGLQAIAVEYTPASPALVAAHEQVELALADNSRFPYRFVGQLMGRKDTYGSGCAIKEKVVLTAAHVVYDNRALADRAGMRWLHMGQGTGRDASLQPRGWVLWGSYSETPGLSYTNQAALEPVRGLATLRTRDIDLAALYFLTPAARGWYSGYLVSGATACATNAWLESTNGKMLVGFPNAGQGFGRMLKLGPRTNALLRMTNADYSSLRVHGSTNLGSFEGNSGAPLCVDAGNGVFYPAAVYLGVTDGKGLYAAVDSAAVSAILNKADYLADTGRSHSGGGGPPEGVAEFPDLVPGDLTVQLVPQAAVAAGASWSLAGLGGPYTNNHTVPFLPAGSYQLTFGAATGYRTPTNRSVTIWPGQTAPLLVDYTPVSAGAAGIGSWSLNGGRVELNLTGGVGVAWVLEASTNLADPVRLGFRPVQTNVMDATGSWRWADTNASRVPERYFRLRSP